MTLSINILEGKKNQYLIVRMIGRLDTITSPQAEKTLFDLISSGEHHVLLNLDGLDYISSAGVKLLLIAAKMLQDNAGNLVLCSPNISVQQVLAISGVTQIVRFSTTEDDALSEP